MRNRVLIVIAGFLLIAAGIVSMPDGKVRVIFCDVGQGDGAIIMQNTTQVLVDTGPDNKKMAECLGKYLPFWDKKIEAIIFSHDDLDHVGGLKEVEKHYLVGQKYSSDNLRENDVIRFGEMVFEVANSEGMVVGELGYKDKRILMMGDADMELEQRLVWRGMIGNGFKPLRTILKVAHHGSANGTSEELLEWVRPDMAVISVGKNNKFGHPTKEVLERLEKFGVEVKRTDEVGDIVLVL